MVARRYLTQPAFARPARLRLLGTGPDPGSRLTYFATPAEALAAIYYTLVEDLLALLDHACEQLAHLGSDEGLALARAYDLGKKAGEARGRSTMKALCTLEVLAMLNEWCEYIPRGATY